MKDEPDPPVASLAEFGAAAAGAAAPTSAGDSLVLIRLKKEAVKLWLSIGGADRISHCEIRFLTGDFASSVVGGIYHSPSEISAVIREMIEHYDHYMDSARSFAFGWADYHNADRLVAELATERDPIIPV